MMYRHTRTDECGQPDHTKTLRCNKVALHISDEHSHTIVHEDGKKSVTTWR